MDQDPRRCAGLSAGAVSRGRLLMAGSSHRPSRVPPAAYGGSGSSANTDAESPFRLALRSRSNDFDGISNRKGLFASSRPQDQRRLMRTSFLHDYLARVVPFLILMLAFAALRLGSAALSIAVVVLSLLALHLFCIECRERRQEMLSERTDLVGRRRETRMDRLMFELWLVVHNGPLGHIPRLGISGIAGLPIGMLALFHSIGAAGP